MTNENSTLVHEGITYRKVNRKANVGEKVLITEERYDFCGRIFTVEGYDYEGDLEFVEDARYYASEGAYVTLERITDEQPLTLTEADVRNNPRRVIDMFASLALKQTQLEAKVERLASANEQAISTVARNVETWAQETEELKRKVADLDTRTQPYQQAHELFVKIASGMYGRDLTAEERREL
jgi:hypothetical protein